MISGNLSITFPVCYMCREFKAWHYFIAAKLMPVSHMSTVIAKRAFLLYAILTGWTIDIGRVISDTIFFCLDHPKQSIYCPSLITTLCTKAGVEWTSSDEVLPSAHVFDNSKIATIIDGSTQDPAPRPLPPQRPAAQLTMPQRLSRLEDAFTTH